MKRASLLLLLLAAVPGCKHEPVTATSVPAKDASAECKAQAPIAPGTSAEALAVIDKLAEEIRGMKPSPERTAIQRKQALAYCSVARGMAGSDSEAAAKWEDRGTRILELVYSMEADAAR